MACDSLNGFKNRLDKFLHDRGLIYIFICSYEFPSLVYYYTVLYYTLLYYAILVGIR